MASIQELAHLGIKIATASVTQHILMELRTVKHGMKSLRRIQLVERTQEASITVIPIDNFIAKI